MTFKRILVLAVCSLGLFSKVGLAETPDIVRSYRIEAKVYSLGVKRNLESYRSHGSGWCSPGSTLGYGIPSKDEPARININLSQRAGRLLADLITRPKGGSEERKQRVDLTDLRAKSVQLAKDSDGRTYEINLTPTVIETRVRPESFRKAVDDLYQLRFHWSRVMLNDKQYIGRMLASDSEVLSVQICGVADLEFSLHRLKDAKPWGQLQEGRIVFKHPDGTSIEIGNVTNGTDDRLVAGGPFQVWVRWQKASETVEGYRAGLSAIRDKLVSGDKVILPNGDTLEDPNTPELLLRIENELAREPGPWVTGCGARGLNSNDLVKD